MEFITFHLALLEDLTYLQLQQVLPYVRASSPLPALSYSDDNAMSLNPAAQFEPLQVFSYDGHLQLPTSSLKLHMALHIGFKPKFEPLTP